MSLWGGACAAEESSDNESFEDESSEDEFAAGEWEIASRSDPYTLVDLSMLLPQVKAVITTLLLCMTRAARRMPGSEDARPEDVFPECAVEITSKIVAMILDDLPFFGVSPHKALNHWSTVLTARAVMFALVGEAAMAEYAARNGVVPHGWVPSRWEVWSTTATPVLCLMCIDEFRHSRFSRIRWRRLDPISSIRMGVADDEIRGVRHGTDASGNKWAHVTFRVKGRWHYPRYDDVDITSYVERVLLDNDPDIKKSALVRVLRAFEAKTWRREEAAAARCGIRLVPDSSGVLSDLRFEESATFAETFYAHNVILGTRIMRLAQGANESE